jgi:nitrite reductase (NADH) large subunit
MTSIAVTSSNTTWWRSAQLVGVGVTVALLAGLMAAPETATRLLWDGAIPLLPAVFLVHPGIWRNVCPLATLNMLPNRKGTGRGLNDRLVPVAGAIGIMLLALLVPARRFLFNHDGTALALTITGVAVLAVALGMVFDQKAGFCSGICPVLPVERLYGQDPLITVGNPRCNPCTTCVTRGCIDLAQSKSLAQVLGRSRKSHAWLQGHYGIFAASFPGFVAGYYLTPDGPLSSAGSVYLTVGLAAVVSYGISQAVVRLSGISAVVAIRLLGAIALGIYYWFAAEVVSTHLALPPWPPYAIRAAAFTLILWWLGRFDWRGASLAVSRSR